MTAAAILPFELLELQTTAPEIEQAEADFIDALLDKFVMNVTALNNYLKCPLQFYYQNLIRIPSGKSEATEFGSAIHHALEKLFRKMQDGKKIHSRPKKKCYLILIGTCTDIVKILPKKHLKEEWNMDRKYCSIITTNTLIVGIQ
jgi:ATP-dependent helicase/DNAse subunit B